MTKEEIIDFCEMKAELEPENEDLYNYIIKLLEQEPFINKHCISAGVCEHDKMQMLDNIRAEINSLHNGCGLFNDGVDASLKVIDKYRNGEQK